MGWEAKSKTWDTGSVSAWSEPVILHCPTCEQPVLVREETAFCIECWWYAPKDFVAESFKSSSDPLGMWISHWDEKEKRAVGLPPGATAVQSGYCLPLDAVADCSGSIALPITATAKFKSSGLEAKVRDGPEQP